MGIADKLLSLGRTNPVEQLGKLPLWQKILEAKAPQPPAFGTQPSAAPTPQAVIPLWQKILGGQPNETFLQTYKRTGEESAAATRAAFDPNASPELRAKGQQKLADMTFGFSGGLQNIAKKGVGKALTSTVDDLAREARKYKTAEEFVGGRGIRVYRGDVTPIKLSEMDTTKVFNPAEKEALGAFNNTPGLYFTDSVSNAKLYGKNLTEVSVKPNAMVINVKDAPKILKRIDVEKIIRSNPEIKDWAMNWSEDFDDAIKQITDSVMMEKDGNEFLKAIWADGGFSASDFVIAMKNAGIDGLKVPKEGVNHFVIYNKDVLQAKSQLKDIWNKANK